MLNILIFQLKYNQYINKQMNSAFEKVSNLKVNRASKIAITFASSTFFLFALSQAPIFKNIFEGTFSCSG